MLATASLLAALPRLGCRAGKQSFSFILTVSRHASTVTISRPVCSQVKSPNHSLWSLPYTFRRNVETTREKLPDRIRNYATGRTVAGLGLRSLQPRFFSANPTFQAAAETTADLPVLTPPTVGYWLLGTTLLIYAVIVVGGVTRLTESGLSITEWKPVSGIIPPLTHSDWEEEFEKYKATPEFKL